MEPLDLSAAPPRSPHADVGGVVFLARTIDKVRAGLPGGNIGLFKLPGLSVQMFEHLGIDEAAFIDAVTRASSDDDVVAFVKEATSAERIAAWNEWAANRKPAGGDREKALVPFPWLADRDEIPVALDCIAEDDRRTFA